MVKVNGTELDIAGKTVTEYLATTNYDPKRIAVERNGDIVFKSQYGEDMKGAVAEDDGTFLENEWRGAAMEEALRRIKDEVNPDHFAAFVASTIEGQDTETVMNLYSITRDNLYQNRKRLTLKLKEATQVVLEEMDNPSTP